MTHRASFNKFTIGDSFDRRCNQLEGGVNVRLKQKQSDIIRQRIKAFFAKGGEIEVVESNCDVAIAYGGRVATDSFDRS